ncbi:MAG: DUF481 domain-containing protein [Chitinophagaceae bacterium]
MIKLTIRLIFISVILSSSVSAQFSDTIDYYVAANLAGNINKTTASVNYLFNNGAKFSIQKDKLAFNTSNNWLYGENAGKLVNNDFTSSTDFNIYRKKNDRFNYWGLANYTSSYSLKIKKQFQGGAGIAYKVIDNPGLMLRVSDGVLYETSNVVINDSTDQVYNTFRNSLRIQCRYKFKKILSFESAAFWQPSLRYSNDYIVQVNAGLNLKLMKWLSFTSKFNYTRVSRTMRENMLITYGIILEQYF